MKAANDDFATLVLTEQLDEMINLMQDARHLG